MQPQGEQPVQSASDLALCLQSLVNEGRPAVAYVSSDLNDADAVPVLEQLDGFAREELALDLPEYSSAVALWAARLFYQLCRFIICRDIPAEHIAALCAIPCPKPKNAESVWSADLTFRHLPRLHQLAHQLSNGDPLLEQIQLLAVDWPLSSVGLKIPQGAVTFYVNSFIGHAGLRRLYADRILATNDYSRLDDPRVADTLRADLSLHRELAPTLAGKLFEPAHDTH